MNTPCCRINRLLCRRIKIDLEFPGSHDAGVNGDEQIAACADWQRIGKLDAHRTVLVGDDQRSQIVKLVDIRSPRSCGVGLPVSPQQGSSLVPGAGKSECIRSWIFSDLDFIIIGSRISCLYPESATGIY